MKRGKATATAEPAALTRGGLRRVLAVLCVTEIVSWGVLYYAFPVLAPTIAADTGWPMATTTAAFSTGLVVSALVGIWSGRLLDRIGPRPVMTAGSVLVYYGTLVHAGGANRSDGERLGISLQYAAAWARQQENFMMAIGVEGARSLPPRLQELIGYSIHPPFMGMIDGRHPKKLLTDI